ncbi:Hypothetical predicted protein [Podarcis lilfordi]|uniref:Uncharacterized protein n=1 Tax=Podarcis lilfordi TaxID=74358 RepID=A0AA35KT92_9SAUR|nr:Hypothetical predicted protein [Podarcis lilfordi]
MFDVHSLLGVLEPPLGSDHLRGLRRRRHSYGPNSDERPPIAASFFAQTSFFLLLFRSRMADQAAPLSISFSQRNLTTETGIPSL